ncbi:MAG: ribonuclease P protein subunit [Candidatus Micrarchaeota archaeon]
MRNKENIKYSTFIGLKVEISNSSQQGLVGLTGIVIDETKNLLVIEGKDGKERKIPKASCTFRFTLDNLEHVEIDGKDIAFRPHERPKKV